jgi:nitroimidazol reductase NimA-like FMN-containing flavoprotein (pyridoxamine 5'-phosphate oxidase superfamily)
MRESHHGKIRELSKAEIEHILRNNLLGRLSLCSDNEPYIVPIFYVYHEGKIYLHMAKKGKKLEFIFRNNRACFEVDEWAEKGWASAVCCGKISLYDDSATKKRVFEVLTLTTESNQKTSAEQIKSMDVYVGVMEIEQMTGRTGQMRKPDLIPEEI